MLTDDLREFPSEEYVEECLRSIPADMAEALEVEPSAMISAISRLHMFMSHWTTRLATATGRAIAAKHARDIGLESIKHRIRHKKDTERLTEASIKEKAVATREYAMLCLEEAQAKTEQLRIQGLVDTISTKKDSLRMLTYYVKHEMDAAQVAYRYVSDDDYYGNMDKRIASHDSTSAKSQKGLVIRLSKLKEKDHEDQSTRKAVCRKKAFKKRQE